jgi:Ca-activated chloride channel family protein
MVAPPPGRPDTVAALVGQALSPADRRSTMLTIPWSPRHKVISRPVAVALLLFAAAIPAHAAGLLQPTDASHGALQIKEHDVSVVINNGFAITEVDQIFYNPHEQDLEAIYTFPLPKEASLSELSLWIDGEEMIGEVVEKERAREIYEEEKQNGRESSLAEKRDYLAFDVFVAPVRARSETRVRLVYYQPLDIDGGIGRYVYPLQEGRIDESMLAFWDMEERVSGRFAFDCLLRTSFPIDEVRARGYEQQSAVRQESNDTWRIHIEDAEGGASLDQDIIVYYRLAQDHPAGVDLLAHRVDDGPGTFMLVITPGADLKTIEEGVDWSIVLDRSGSMETKLASATEALVQSLDRLRPQDRFRIIVFSDKARAIIGRWTPVTPDSIDRARDALRRVETKGGTNLYAGFEKGIDNLDEERTAALILVSDGGANVGPTEHRDFRRLLETTDIRVFTFVMGQGATRPLLDRLAEESGGFSMDVSNGDDLYGRIVQAKDKLGREAMHGVEIEVDGVSIVGQTPQQMPNAYYGQQIVLFGRYNDPGSADLRLRARISGNEKTWQTRVTFPAQQTLYPELERLWALARIDELGRRAEDEGEDSELRRAIVDLGIAYSLVTDHTSMIVVRKERFEELGIDRTNRDRVENERQARALRAAQAPQATRVDTNQPMFNQPMQRTRGGGGGGAAGPELVGLFGALIGIRAWIKRRRGRS